MRANKIVLEKIETTLITLIESKKFPVFAVRAKYPNGSSEEFFILRRDVGRWPFKHSPAKSAGKYIDRILNAPRYFYYSNKDLTSLRASFSEGIEFGDIIDKAANKKATLLINRKNFDPMKLLHYGDDEYFYQFEHHLPFSLPYHIGYIRSGLCSKDVCLTTARAILKNRKEVYNIRTVPIPYYNTVLGHSALTYTVHLDQKTHDKLYEKHIKGKQYALVFAFDDIFSIHGIDYLGLSAAKRKK